MKKYKTSSITGKNSYRLVPFFNNLSCTIFNCTWVIVGKSFSSWGYIAVSSQGQRCESGADLLQCLNFCSAWTLCNTMHASGDREPARLVTCLALYSIALESLLVNHSLVEVTLLCLHRGRGVSQERTWTLCNTWLCATGCGSRLFNGCPLWHCYWLRILYWPKL